MELVLKSLNSTKINSKTIRMDMDAGSVVSIMSQRSRLHNEQKSYTGEKIAHSGVLLVTANYKNEDHHNTELYNINYYGPALWR